jgi:hypothetical protein
MRAQAPIVLADTAVFPQNLVRETSSGLEERHGRIESTNRQTTFTFLF